MDFIEVFILSVMGIIGSIIITQLFQLNWFKKENFKIRKSNLMAENRIKIKKLERELNLNLPPIKEEKTGSILDAIKGLDKDKIQGILELLGGDQEIEAEASPLDTLLKMVSENPQIINKVLGSANLNEDSNKENPKYL